MEGKLNDLPETENDVGTITGGSTKKPSKTQLVEYDSDSNSPRSTHPESYTRSISQEVVELSSDDDVQIIDIKGQKGAETLEKGHEQYSSGRSSPKDLTCSVCLSEYDNKAFLDKCFRILLSKNVLRRFYQHLYVLLLSLNQTQNNTCTYLPTLPVFPGVSKFFMKSPGLPVRAPNLPGITYRGSLCISYSLIS